MRAETEQGKILDAKGRGKLVLRKETLKKLNANGLPKKEVADFPSDTTNCSDCCHPDDDALCIA
jgi:hypothetical protein